MIIKIIKIFIISIIIILLLKLVFTNFPISFSFLHVLPIISKIVSEPKNQWQLKNEAETKARFDKWRENLKLEEQRNREKIKHDDYIIGQAWRQALLWSWIACWTLWWYLWKDDGYP